MPVTITTRAGKGSALSAAENDANLTALQGGVFSVTTIKTAAYTASTLEIVRTDTTAGALTVTLPASPTDGMRVIVEDSATAGSWGANPLTVAPNGSKINNSASTFSAASKWGRCELFYVGAAAGWFTRFEGNTRPFQVANNLGEISGSANQAAAKANLGIAEAPGAGVTSVGPLYSGGTRLFSSAAGSFANTTTTLTALTEYYSLFWWSWGFTPSLLGIEVTTLVAAAQVKVAIYLQNADFSIGTQVAVTGTLSGATVGQKTATIAPGANWAGPGLYWVGYHSDQAVGVRALGTVGNWAGLLPVRSGNTGTAYLSRASIAFASALPATAPALTALSPGTAGLLGAVLMGSP